ncbi:MAG: Asp-tRNA(Asn)/Glu-tRNA(Gln) amidotransferase subunit GatC [Clostridiales bacterium]|jgi:aspartyl-tRNA(Asn)/glutamyl-tRNA(Gln) amidotransferase subunit C|nr:Asp-tRNA(Asn)/Glu-tRNA(Gln) amidotransferase subunit GatC [Clostridiales bacterium]
MAISREDAEKLARLAMFEISEEEADSFLKKFNEVLKEVDKIFEVDTAGVEPCFNISLLTNVFREDEVKPSLDYEELFKNAPAAEDNCYLVPNVIE